MFSLLDVIHLIFSCRMLTPAFSKANAARPEKAHAAAGFPAVSSYMQSEFEFCIRSFC